MPFDSQGNFTRVMNWQEDAANSIPILASRHDDEDDNFANGFNEVMCRDGRTQMTGQLKMGSNKIVGVATGTANTDAVNKGQLDSALAGAVAGKQNTITGGASSITSSNLTTNRALISNGSGKVAVSTTTNTELGYVHGVTSAIQTQIDSKQATITGAATTITSSNLTTNRALTSDGNGKVAVSSTTATELGYVHGVTSAIQTQINNISSGITTAISNLLSSLYPVNSIYIGVQSTCPLATLISGSTWTKVATKIVTDVSSTVSVKGTGKTLGLTNGSVNIGLSNPGSDTNANGRLFDTASYNVSVSTSAELATSRSGKWGVVTDASKSGLTGTATSTTLTVNIWQRTA